MLFIKNFVFNWRIPEKREATIYHIDINCACFVYCTYLIYHIRKYFLWKFLFFYHFFFFIFFDKSSPFIMMYIMKVRKHMNKIILCERTGRLRTCSAVTGFNFFT